MNKTPEGPRRALGKGLTALLRPPTAPEPAAEPAESVTHLPIDAIDPNPLQPRRVFESERLEELAQSIRANGIIQPLVVRRHGARYQLVAGERRWRAAKLAKLAQVPAVVQEIPDERLLEITLIENIQREDLNPIETALAFDRLSRELHLNHEEIGRRTGKDRTTITNLIRLLQLPSDLQQLLAEKKLSAGHARCLLSLPSVERQRELAQKSIEEGWPVRQLERVTQRIAAGPQPKPAAAEPPLDPNVKAAIAELERVLGTKVRIVEKARQRGRIEIDYYSSEDLDRIYTAIVGESN
ncbi:MAG TPA: ParB/RepB/Spo0J family partition protein [Bryobacteraceae bacterium]|jgi:ParB family chromosome partitioning protein|nr:ParB/RepB/Spo0J family partition protein [Bryobacteraceae bacterium]